MTEAKQAVKELNDTLFNSEHYEHAYFCYLEYTETPIGEFIKYYGQVIWDSENDYREAVGEELEDLKTFLVKEVGKIKQIIALSHTAMKD